MKSRAFKLSAWSCLAVLGAAVVLDVSGLAVATPTSPGFVSEILARSFFEKIRVNAAHGGGESAQGVQNGDTDFTRPVSSVMGKSPRTVAADDLATSAAEVMREGQFDQLPVVDEHGRPIGLLDVQDLLAARLLG